MVDVIPFPVKKPIKREEIGRVVVDTAAMVVLSQEVFLKILQQIKPQATWEDVPTFVKAIGGVLCKFDSDGVYGVDRVTVLYKNGDESKNALLISAGYPIAVQ